jgi:hypothetical protein
MDNEVLVALKMLLTKDFQLSISFVPPNIQCCNAAEQAICMFKNHFISRLCLADNDFLLLGQAVTAGRNNSQLNESITGRPKHISYEAILGPFNHNKTPLVPPGCKVLIPKKPSQHRTECLCTLPNCTTKSTHVLTVANQCGSDRPVTVTGTPTHALLLQAGQAVTVTGTNSHR